MVGLTTAALADAARPPAATVAERAVRVWNSGRTLLVSDSAWLGIYNYGSVDVVQGFEHDLALASCRRRVVTSCRNYDGYVPPTLLDVLEERGADYSTLIVATGYNDSDRAFRSEFETIVRTARELGHRRIVWMTLRTNDVSYVSPDESGDVGVFARNNAALRDLVESGAYPDVVLADWATYSRGDPTWFSGDGIHVRPLGSVAVADYISRKMAFLDGRRCPQPVLGGAVPDDPCPDPDVTGALVDLESVYPIRQVAPVVPFRLEFFGHGAWPDPAWWES